MKQIGFLIITIFFAFTQSNAQTKEAKVDMAFDKTVNGVTAHDFGSIVYGANGKVDFTFTNNGKKPLVITNVESSCGCAVPTWTKEPVAPGQKGTVTVVYNTTIAGVFNKTIAVTSNANNSPVRLEIRGKVNATAADLKSKSGQNPASIENAVIEPGDQLEHHKNVKEKLEKKSVESQAAGQKSATATGAAATKTVTPVKK